MAESLKADICVIGAGSGGLSVAAGAAQLGANVVLIERGAMGGDCLNSGCVPSKSMIAAGHRADVMRSSRAFGITPVTPSINHKAVADHIQQVIEKIAPNDSVERFTGLGVRVIRASASFVDKSTVAAGDFEIRARRFVIATGSSPTVPPIPGLDRIPFMTNETVFHNVVKPEHLIIIGGGPIGIELAQAHYRLGSKVTVLEAMKALGKDDPELTHMVLEKLRGEGIGIHEGVLVEGAEVAVGGGVRLRVTHEGESHLVEGTHLLVATGRKPNVEGLNLDAAGIKFDRRGIKVNSGLVTSNSRVFAIGDVVGELQFTHVANYHAGIVIRRALFRIPAKVNRDIIPWVTYTDPEIAHIGLAEDEARKRFGRVNVLRWPYHENDRAQAERATEGLVKVVVARNGRILGATIAGSHAGELIHMWSLAISAGLPIKAMASYIAPYPTLSEINKRAATSHYVAKLANPWLRKAVQLLGRLS